MPLKLATVQDPQFSFFDFEDQERKVDPFRVIRDIEAAVAALPKDQPPTMDQMADVTRAAFGFPTEAEAKEANKQTLSYHQCRILEVAVNEYLADLEVTKKARALSGNSSAATKAG